MSKSKKAITWQQLKDFCNSLPAVQLRKGVLWWGEERGGRIHKAFQLPEDFCQTDYGIEPSSVQEYEVGDDPYPITHPKGTPILETD